MSTNELIRYGLHPVGKVQIVDGRFSVVLTESTSGNLEQCIYAYIVGDEILRVGSSKAKLGSRLRAWQADVSKALSGDYSRTPQREVEIWRDMLTTHGVGELYARKGTVVTTPVGEFNLYQYEERALIARHKPRCCNDVKLARTP